MIPNTSATRKMIMLAHVMPTSAYSCGTLTATISLKLTHRLFLLLVNNSAY